MPPIHLTNQHSRMTREARTIEAMIRIYCRGQHGTRAGLCPECTSLQEYAGLRLEKCPYQEEKTTCAKCPVHCYKQTMREQIRAVMRYAGPRMLWRHPVLALLHLLVDSRREATATNVRRVERRG